MQPAAAPRGGKLHRFAILSAEIRRFIAKPPVHGAFRAPAGASWGGRRHIGGDARWLFCYNSAAKLLFYSKTRSSCSMPPTRGEPAQASRSSHWALREIKIAGDGLYKAGVAGRRLRPAEGVADRQPSRRKHTACRVLHGATCMGARGRLSPPPNFAILRKQLKSFPVS